MWARVPVSDVRAERDRDGLLRVLVTAETSTPGWRIYTNHQIQSRDTLDVRLMGIPPSQYGSRQTSRPTAAPIFEDPDGEYPHIVVHTDREPGQISDNRFRIVFSHTGSIFAAFFIRPAVLPTCSSNRTSKTRALRRLPGGHIPAIDAFIRIYHLSRSWPCKPPMISMS